MRVVHIAPAFGEDDLNVGLKEGLPVVDPVDLEGNFTDLVPPYQGKNVFVANRDIIRDLKAEPGVVIRHETYDHNYPHCWRTDEPLIYKAMPSWYVAVTRFRDRMVELNQGIEWTPPHVKDGIFGNWLANALDWNIGRNRFWGAPIPVWKSDDPKYPRIDCYGSLDEIEGVGPARKRALLHAFGSARGVARASADDLAKVEGVSEALAQRIFAAFRKA